MKKMIGLLLAALMLLCGCARREQAPQTEPVTLRVVTSFGSEDGNRRNFEAARRGLRGLDPEIWCPMAPTCPARNGKPES